MCPVEKEEGIKRAYFINRERHGAQLGASWRFLFILSIIKKLKYKEVKNYAGSESFT